MIRLQMKNFNMILTEKLQTYRHGHEENFTNMNIYLLLF